MQLDRMMRRTRLGLGLLAGIGLAAPASAALFTLDSSVHFGPGGSNSAEGLLLPVNSTSGTLGTTDGTVNLATQDFFIFQVVLCDTGDPLPCSGAISGDVDFITVSVDPNSGPPPPFDHPVGTGHIDPGGGEQAPNGASAVFNDQFDAAGEFRFDFGNNTVGNLEAGETTHKLFVTFNAGELSVGNGVSFMFQSGTTFDVSNLTIVPEPATALLLGAGLLGLAVAGRRR